MQSRTRSIHAVLLAAAAQLMFTLPAGCGVQRQTVQYPNWAETDFGSAAHRPPTAKTLYQMAKMLAARGRDVEAQTVLTTCLGRYPPFLPAYVEMADLHVRHRKFDAAIDILMQALERSPDDPIIHNNLGMCWLLRRDYEQSLAEFTKAAEASPDDARFRGNLALATGMLGLYEEALALYLQLVSPAQAHYNLALICEAREDQTRAKREFSIAKSMGGPGIH